ncbi:hypothetical protein NFI96_007500 [Prochilodus magdalenae]|nr:hypothetical protein NFI96_007500 [Prochilodus magdalenae]
MGKRNKPGVDSAGSPDSVSVRGRGENKAINDLDRDFWNNNDSSNVQQRWSSYPPKEFLLNMSPYAPYGDPRLTPNGTLEKGEAGGGAGGGPSRSDSARSIGAGSSKAGKWHTVQSHMHSGNLRPSKSQIPVQIHSNDIHPFSPSFSPPALLISHLSGNGFCFLVELEYPHTVPADGAVGVEVEGHQAFWTCDNKPFILVLTTVPPPTDSLVASTKTKAGLVTEDDPLPF